MVENSINKENTPTKTEEFFTPSENYYVTPNDNEDFFIPNKKEEHEIKYENIAFNYRSGSTS